MEGRGRFTPKGPQDRERFRRPGPGGKPGHPPAPRRGRRVRRSAPRTRGPQARRSPGRKGSERAGGREEQMKRAPVRGADHRPEGGLGRGIFTPEEIEAPGALAAGAVKGDETAVGAPALRQSGHREGPPENVPPEGPPVQRPREGGGAEPGHCGVVGLPVQELGAHLHPAGRKAERRRQEKEQRGKQEHSPSALHRKTSLYIGSVSFIDKEHISFIPKTQEKNGKSANVPHSGGRKYARGTGARRAGSSVSSMVPPPDGQKTFFFSLFKRKSS